MGSSRLDFYLENADERCWMEVKSVTLVEDGRGLFPDAPTERGRKHIAELTKLRQAGARAVALFVVQRADAHSVTANHRTDPKFAEALLRRPSLRGRVLRLYLRNHYYPCSAQPVNSRYRGVSKPTRSLCQP